MSRCGNVCPGKTSKAAIDTCAKKTNLLVYKRGDESCRPRQKNYTPPISHAKMKRIRMCTGKEMRKMCAPPPCPCPTRPPPPTLFQRLARLTALGAKGALALGITYITYDMGIWGDSETTGAFYTRLCNALMPGTPKKSNKLPHHCEEEQDLIEKHTKKDPFCCDKFPIDSETKVYDWQQKWNRVVVGVFHLPLAICTSIHNGFKALVGKEEEKKPKG